jgi:cytochrome c oxidase subunit I
MSLHRHEPALPALFEHSAVARQWFGLALAVLVLAGLFALAVVVGRMPPFDRFVTDPLFFKRCLVAHVNLALVVWFYSFVAALLALGDPGRPSLLARHSIVIAGAGVVAMLAGAAVPGAPPVLANYIPTIDHWLFQVGQIAFGAGVLTSSIDSAVRQALRSECAENGAALPDSVRYGLRAAAVALALAATTFAVSALRQPSGLAPEAQFELLVWGVGHVLQLVCVLAMVSVWLLLLASALGESPVSDRAAAVLFFSLAAPWSIAPFLAFQGGAATGARSGFTQLMQWSIFPIVSIFVVLCLGTVQRAWRAGLLDTRSLRDPRIVGVAVSVTLTLLGFALGAAIRGSNTMVPAHYHAAVGGVTVSFMTAALVLLGAAAPSAPRVLRRAAAAQPLLYGGGMLLFAAGFALAGAHGMGRKMYGAEQASRTLVESVGLAVMGFGGFVAVAGGVLFLGVALAAWRLRPRSDRRVEVSLISNPWRWTHGSSR